MAYDASLYVADNGAVPGTILPNEMGDVEISWHPDNEAKVIDMIEKKMKEGVSFYILKPIIGELIQIKTKLTKISDLKANRVSVKDADIEALFSAGAVHFYRNNTSGTLETTRRAKDAKEVVRNRTVGLKPLQGG